MPIRIHQIYGNRAVIFSFFTVRFCQDNYERYYPRYYMQGMQADDYV